jgi:hypothetical protein
MKKLAVRQFFQKLVNSFTKARKAINPGWLLNTAVNFQTQLCLRSHRVKTNQLHYQVLYVCLTLSS